MNVCLKIHPTKSKTPNTTKAVAMKKDRVWKLKVMNVLKKLVKITSIIAIRNNQDARPVKLFHGFIPVNDNKVIKL
jgi:hypothetical protein